MQTDLLFQPFHLKSLTLKNRFVMAPMTRAFSPEGIPTSDVAAYYRRRAEGGIGLILSEGTVIDRPASANNPRYPHFYGDEALAGWKQVIESVHEAGGRMGPQLWHVGDMTGSNPDWSPPQPFEGPSGLRKPGEIGGVAMSEADIQDTIAAYGSAAGDARRLGFDLVEIHGAHGYLIDQFLWAETNHRSDAYGGTTLQARARFAIEIVQAVRQAVGDDFVISLRLSQWKMNSIVS